MPNSPLVQLLALLVLAGCGFAFVKGRIAERVAAAVILCNLILAFAANALLDESLAPLIGLLIDGVSALVLLFVTLRYGTPWLGAAMLLYAAQFTLHSFYLVSERPSDRFHAAVNNFIFVAVMLCLVAGTATAWRRRSLGAAPS